MKLFYPFFGLSVNITLLMQIIILFLTLAQFLIVKLIFFNEIDK
jgi:hypothetical protein